MISNNGTHRSIDQILTMLDIGYRLITIMYHIYGPIPNVYPIKLHIFINDLNKMTLQVQHNILKLKLPTSFTFYILINYIKYNINYLFNNICYTL